MRSFNPANVSVKKVWDADPATTSVAAKAAPEVEAPAPREVALLGSDLVAALKEMTERMTESYRADSRKNMDIVIAAVTEKHQPIVVSTPKTPPCAYTFEIERDANGLASKIHAYPIIT
jgi:L-lactate utilization protein LutC